MERRQEPRIETDQEVVVTVLNGQPMCAVQGRVVDLSGRGLRMILPARVELNAPLKIEFDDCLFLGEVAYCRDLVGQWLVGVDVQHSMVHLQDLERLRRSLMELDMDRNADVTMKVSPHGSPEIRPEKDGQPPANRFSAKG